MTDSVFFKQRMGQLNQRVVAFEEFEQLGRLRKTIENLLVAVPNNSNILTVYQNYTSMHENIEKVIFSPPQSQSEIPIETQDSSGDTPNRFVSSFKP